MTDSYRPLWFATSSRCAVDRCRRYLIAFSTETIDRDNRLTCCIRWAMVFR